MQNNYLTSKAANNSYIPQSTNKLFKKLLRKVCNKNTPSNTFFHYYNKFDVYITSGTPNYIVVSVHENVRPYTELAHFSIDFNTNTLTFHLQTYGKDFYDYSIEDSIIDEFVNLYADQLTFTTIKIDYETLDDVTLYNDILSNKEEYDDDVLKEAQNAIDFINARLDWIGRINSL